MFEKVKREDKRFDAIRQVVVEELCKIGSPVGVDATYASLLEELDELMGCPCPRCLEKARMSAETIVVIEEVMKMTSAGSEAGVCALIHKMHTRQAKRYIETVDLLLEGMLTQGQVLNQGQLPEGGMVPSSDDLPPEIKSRLFEVLRDHLSPEEEK